MMFDAGNAVPKLEYDFTRYKGGKGVSPEPSTESLAEFAREWRTMIEAIVRVKKSLALSEASKLEGRPAEEKMAEVELWAAMDWREAQAILGDELTALSPPAETIELSEKQAELCARVFDNVPSVEDILKLPGRVRTAYYGWVVGQLLDPEAVAAGMS